MSGVRSLEGLLAAPQDVNDDDIIHVLTECARQSSNVSFREQVETSTIDDSSFLPFLTSRWLALQHLDGSSPSTIDQGVAAIDDDDDDGLSYSYTTTTSDSAATDIPSRSAFLDDSDAASTHVNVLLAMYRVLRNICASSPINQTKLKAVLPFTTNVLTGMIGYLDCSHDEELHAVIVTCMQVMLQFVANMTVHHTANQDILWPAFHPHLLEKVLVECQKYQKVLAYAAAVVLNCLHPPHAIRTTDLVKSRQIVILLLQRCLSFQSQDESDPALEWITMIFQVLVKRHYTADLYRNLSASLLSTLWSKLTPEQMLLLRMVDLVVAPDDSSSPVDGVESSRSNDDLIAFLCAEYTGLHVPNEAPSNKNDVNAAVSADRQAMWNVMETESSKLMLRILGTLTSSACVEEHSENVLTFIPVLIAQLQRLSPTHARETNAAAALSGDDVVQDETFGYRSAGVRVLGNMAHRNPSVQDALRACGGLEVLLNSCNIDPNNPMIREWALVALRHVCEGNEQNQAYIRALAPQQVVSRVDLSKMGVEPVLEHNKVTLKPL